MKKIRILVLALVGAVQLFAADIMHQGVVLERLDAGVYSYLHIQDASKKYWIAVNKVELPDGAQVRFKEELRAKNFDSKALNRSFDEIIFASGLEYRTQLAASSQLAFISQIVAASPYKQKDTMSIKQAFDERAKLAGNSITIRAKVVKISKNILDRNWIHMQDGTAIDGSVGRIVFTSKESDIQVGDILRATGIVAVDKDFGSGYVYKMIVEQAEFQK